ncbi:Tn3 family transposase [Nonomuraea pusilla]|uniref:Tn3 family transposase n=1 Tax=Nonomuraea pusilla TaxID=46177 RepID=UPI003320BB95
MIVSLKDALRRREIDVAGARRWRSPEEDLPADFEDNRDVHYENLRQPLDASVFIFIATLKEAMRASMAACGQAISRNKSGGAKVKTHRGEPRWHIPDLGKLKVPENLRALHTEVAARWGNIDLLDFLKESDFVTDFTDAFTTVATREATPREVIRKRLLLVLYALGTNMGIKRVADGGRHGKTEAALRATRHLFVNRDNLRAAIATLVNATLRMRDPLWWGNGTACASDSKKFGSWSSNLMTEYHARYGGPGVMIYWHVDRKSVCVYSQLRSCNASEVAAMMEGVLRHCTDATIDRQCTDSHGQSLVGFAFSYLLGFKLLPRMKRIAHQKLVKADADDQVPSCLTGMVADKPIDWEIIARRQDVAQVVRAKHPEGVRIVYDHLGGAEIAPGTAFLAPGGVLAGYAFMGRPGHVLADTIHDALRNRMLNLLPGKRTALCTLPREIAADPSQHQTLLTHLFELALGRHRPRIGGAASRFAQAAEAHRALERRDVHRKIILTTFCPRVATILNTCLVW